MSTYTPGPWRVESDGDTQRDAIGPFEVQGGDRRALALIRPSFRTAGEQKANARLIAAAPDLLEVLRECEDLLDDYSDVRDGDYGEPRPNRAMSLLSRVQRVIEKAEG